MAVCKATALFAKISFLEIFYFILYTLFAKVRFLFSIHIKKSHREIDFFSIVNEKKIICIKNRYYAADSVN